MRLKLDFKKLIIILFVIFTSSILSKNFLWEVKSKTSKVYILGSIHVGKKSSFPLNINIENAFNETKNLAVEVDIDSVDPMSLMKYMVYSDSNSLASSLVPEVYLKLIKLFDEVGLPEIVYSKLKPWAAIMMAQQLSMKSEGLSAENGIDKYFMDKARGKKNIISLETAEYQMSILEEFDKVSNEFVEYSLKDMKDGNEQVEKMYDAWKVGDDEAIEQIILNEENEFPGYKSIMEKLLYKRNENMTTKIKEWLKGNQNYFVVVGAGHLVGNRGIINLLKQNKVYEIEQK